jgi:hypothetical protein
VYATAPLAVVETAFEGCSARMQGGALWLETAARPAAPIVLHCNFRRCTASQGGAVALVSGNSSASISCCKFESGSAVDGAAIFSESQELNITATQFTGLFALNPRHGRNKFVGVASTQWVQLGRPRQHWHSQLHSAIVHRKCRQQFG